MKVARSHYWRFGRWQVEWHPDGKNRWLPLGVREGWPQPWREWTALGEHLAIVLMAEREDQT